MSSRPFIPVCEPFYMGNEEKYALDAINSRWISSMGSYIEQFENGFSAYCQASHGISTTSGTTALHLALAAMGIGEGDEVVIPDFTMVAVLFAVLYCRATPVFVDADASTWNMDISKLESAITEKTACIIPVHIYGHPVDMDPLLYIAKKHSISVVEDAAQAHGAQYKGKMCGSIGTLGCFSFYANKIITTGEGGMVITSEPQIAERCRYYKNLCFARGEKRDYLHADVGFNYRMTNVQAALGLAQLEHIEEFVERRRSNAKAYTELLSAVPGIQAPVEMEYAKNVYWMYGIVIDPDKFGVTRDELAQKLSQRGVQTRNFFRPMHSQPALKKLGLSSALHFPVTESLSRNGLYLPSGSGLSARDIEYVCHSISEIQRGS